jgi:hypothetical protein
MYSKSGRMFVSFAMIPACGLMPASKMTESIAES